MKAPKNSKLKELQKQNTGKEMECVRCGKMKEITIDHIIPKHLLEQLGLFDEILNCEDNFELTCRACNGFKGGRIDLANPKTIPLLKMFIERL